MADDLRARLTEALDHAYTSLDDFDAEVAADAVLAVVQPELDRRRAQTIAEVEAMVRDRASVLQGTVAQATAEAIANLIAGMADNPGGA